MKQRSKGRMGCLTVPLVAAPAAFAALMLVSVPPGVRAQGANEEEVHEIAEGEEAEGHHAVNPTELLGQLVNVIVLVGLFVFLYKKTNMRQSLVARRRDVEENLADARAMHAKAKATYDEYAQRLANLDRELDALRREMVAAGEAERDRIVEEAEKKAARIRRESEFLAEQRAKQLRAELTRDVARQAVEAAEKLLAERTTHADQQRLANEYLARLGALAGRPVARAADAPRAKEDHA